MNDVIRLADENTVETVVLLSGKTPDDTIEVDLDLDELDITSAEVKASYQEIKDYVLKEFGLKVSTLYISQIKRKCGIDVGGHHKVLYNTLLLDGELVKHLNEVDDTVNQRTELLTLQMQERQGVNEALKARDQMAWVGTCNNIRNAAEEIVLSKIVYV